MASTRALRRIQTRSVTRWKFVSESEVSFQSCSLRCLVLFSPLSHLRLPSRRRKRRRRSKSSRSFADQTWIAVPTIAVVPGQIGEYRNVSSTTTFQIRKMQAVLEASSSYKIKTLTQTKGKHKHSPTTRGGVNQKNRYYCLPFFLSPSLPRSASANVSFAKTQNSVRVSQSSTCTHKCTQLLTKTLPRPQKRNGDRHGRETATTIHSTRKKERARERETERESRTESSQKQRTEQHLLRIASTKKEEEEESTLETRTVW